MKLHIKFFNGEAIEIELNDIKEITIKLDTPDNQTSPFTVEDFNRHAKELEERTQWLKSLTKPHEKAKGK